MPGGHVAFQGAARKANPRRYTNVDCKERKAAHGKEPVRLFVKGVVQGYTGGKKNTHHHTALLRLQDVNDPESARFYFGKRVAYIYRGKKADKFGNKIRVIWGRVTRSHGNSGAVRATFSPNLPCSAVSKQVRVMLYPSSQ